VASDAGVHFTDFATQYQSILDGALATIAAFPPLLRDLAAPLLPELGEGEFSRIVALLPYWLAGPLDELRSPQPDRPPAPLDQAGTLGLANLLGWWSYLIQDGLLDRDLEQPHFLPLAMAFYAAAVRLLGGLLPRHSAFWEAFQHLSLTSAEAHLWEQRRRFQIFAGLEASALDPEAFDLDDLDRLADRSALLQFSVVAQFALQGLDREHPLCQALVQMLRHYAIARQIGDDLADWVADLQRGRLNYVSARVVRRLVESGAVQAGSALDADRMAGYFLYDDGLFADIQQVAMAACQRATDSLVPFETPYLDALVAALAAQLERSYRAALDNRRELRAQFQA
jgi:hypothetical protein